MGSEGVMRCLATTVLCLFTLVGCSGWVVFISPSGFACTSSVDIIPSPTRPPPARNISSGITVHGTLSGCHPADEFNVAVVADGTLVIRLSWATVHTSTISVVSINGTEFRSAPPDWLPVVAKVPATRGRQYRLLVALQASDETPEDRYELTTSLE
jgi:hypothetical protein